MGEPAVRLPSFEDLYAQIATLPQGTTGEILEPGTLRTMSRPGRAHRRCAKVLEGQLGGFDVDRGGTGWWIEVEAEIRFPSGRLAVPDLAGWRVERVPELPDENPLTILPDWCGEILSPGTAADDRALKLPLYASSGVGWVWLVDPSLKLVEVFESVGGRPVLARSARRDEKPVLPPFDVAFELASWWLPEQAPPATPSGSAPPAGR